MERLREKSLEKLHPAWDRWSHHYAIDANDVTVYAMVPGGHKKLFGSECILNLFLKKSCSSLAVANYNFSSVLELQLHFSGAFCNTVNLHHMDEEG